MNLSPLSAGPHFFKCVRLIQNSHHRIYIYMCICTMYGDIPCNMVAYRCAVLRQTMTLFLREVYARAARPIGHLRYLNYLRFATTDKTIFVGSFFSKCLKKASELDIPFWARSGPDFAKEVRKRYACLYGDIYIYIYIYVYTYAYIHT